VGRIILLVLDNAGWHGPANLKIPDGVRLIYLPPYTPELQLAETLWALVDEPIVNTHIDHRGPRSDNRQPLRRPRRAARADPVTWWGNVRQPRHLGNPSQPHHETPLASRVARLYPARLRHY